MRLLSTDELRSVSGGNPWENPVGDYIDDEWNETRGGVLWRFIAENRIEWHHGDGFVDNNQNGIRDNEDTLDWEANSGESPEGSDWWEVLQGLEFFTAESGPGV